MNASPCSSGGLDLLTGLVEQARRQTTLRRQVLGEVELLQRIAEADSPRDLAAAVRRNQTRLAVIAECKRRSPSAGLLTSDYRPADRATRYAAGGAVAVSVLTHEDGFGGRPEDLTAVREAVDLPLLRKDFVTDEYEVDEARALGADAVLLIAAALEPPRLAALTDRVHAHNMTALVEVHDETEVDIALETGARAIGVNHRDLRTFHVDPTLTARLRPRIGRDRLLVAESGVTGRASAESLRTAGADALLVGELLMRTDQPETTIAELTGDNH